MDRKWKANTSYVSLFRRSISTLLLARRISKSVRKLEREVAENPKLDRDEVSRRWAELHRQNARLAHDHIVRYRGLLAKVGQAASTKAGELPAPWLEQLQGLQDELPVSSIRQVRQTVRTDLGRSVDDLFANFDESPVASASVAQAHVATLRATGRKVCVKVQHRGVASMMGMDLATVDWICRRAGKHHRNAPDASNLIKEWRRSAKEEVNFQLEGGHAERASGALKRLGIDVGVPVPVAEASGKRVLTMQFIEGAKITDTARLPATVDREALLSSLVDAFAALALNEGIIHGDPHPGNVFAQHLPDGSVRAALLDWGIVREMSRQERHGAARWVLATLAHDRSLYYRSMLDLGFVFGTGLDLESAAFIHFLDQSMNNNLWMFRDSMSAGAQAQLLEQMSKLQQAQAQAVGPGSGGASTASRAVLHSVPGVVMFFLRALGLLQQICGSLGVAVPFSTIISRRALQALEEVDRAPPPPLPAPSRASDLEMAVRSELQLLEESGSLVGAQVAVLSAANPSGQSGWAFRVAAGRRSLTGGPLTDDMLMPLVEASLGPLLMCLLLACREPTVAGKVMTLECAVAHIWPDFAQREKGSLTIANVIQHQAGLSLLWPPDLTLKGFLSEQRMEQVLASAPCDGGQLELGDGLGEPSWGVGAIVAALLRRAVGKSTVADALKTMLRPLGLDEDIVYNGDFHRMAFVSRKPREGLPMHHLHSWAERQIQSLRLRTQQGGQRLSWQEFTDEKPICTDALLVNRDCVREGEFAGGGERAACCVPSRGIRATATALCRLFAADLLSEDLLAKCVASPTAIAARSRDEWNDFGVPMEVSAAGWRIFRFRRKQDDAEVIGYGVVDGTTGSTILRLPDGVACAVLLTCTRSESQHAGSSLIRIISNNLGLEPLWPEEAPSTLPATRKVSCRVEGAKVGGGGGLARTGSSAPRPNPRMIRELEQKVAALEKALPNAALRFDAGSEGGSSGDRSSGTMSLAMRSSGSKGNHKQGFAESPNSVEEHAKGIAGSWVSVEMSGLDDILELFEVPKMMRSMVARAKRTLRVEVDGNDVSLTSTWNVMGKTIEDVSKFAVGQAFDGEQTLGGRYKATSWQLQGDDAEPIGIERGVAVERHFNIEGQPLTIVERYELQTSDKLVVTTVLRAFEDQPARVGTEQDRELLMSCLDAETLELRRAVLLGEVRVQKTSRIIACSTVVGLPSYEDLTSMSLPAVITARYNDVTSSTIFEREGSRNKSRGGWTERIKQGAVSFFGRGRNSNSPDINDEPPEDGAIAAVSGESPAVAGASARGSGQQGKKTSCSGSASRLGGCGEMFCQVCHTAQDAAPLALAGCASGALAVGWLASAVGSVAWDVIRDFANALCSRDAVRNRDTNAARSRRTRAFGDARIPSVEADAARNISGGSFATNSNSSPTSSVRNSTGTNVIGQHPGWSSTHSLQRVNTSRHGGVGGFGSRSECSTIAGRSRFGSSTVGGVERFPLAAVAEDASVSFDRLSLVRPPPSPSSDASVSRSGTSVATSPRGAANRPQSDSGLQGGFSARTLAQNAVQFHGFRDSECHDAEPRHTDLGLSHDLGSEALRLCTPCQADTIRQFSNAEAAFYACTFWPMAGTFEKLNCEAARRKHVRLKEHSDPTFAGFGSAWRAMLAVQEAKFSPKTNATLSLLGTGDAYLLAKGPSVGSSSLLDGADYWTDGGNGKGANLLGLALLLLRDSIRGTSTWTRYLGSLFDLRSPQGAVPWNDHALEEWRSLVRAAAASKQGPTNDVI